MNKVSGASKKNSVHRRNVMRLIFLAVAVLIAVAFYLLLNSHPEKPKLFAISAMEAH